MKRFVWTLIFLMSVVSTSWAGGPGSHCTDHYGRDVAWVDDASQPKLADSLYRANGAPQIHFNKEAGGKSGLSEDAQTFFFNHECGRLVLGHVGHPGNSLSTYNVQVDQADCWAASQFNGAGAQDKLNAVEAEINGLEPAKWVNIGGPVRKLNLARTCSFKGGATQASAVQASTAQAGAMHCTDHYGRVVAWVDNTHQSKLANAIYRANGAPQIHINKDAGGKSGLSADAQTFLYSRECGRLVLGHLVRPGTNMTDYNDQIDQADCWAANEFYYAGELDKLKEVETEINELEQAKWVNLAGPVRKLDLENTCRFIKPNWN